MKVCHKLGEMQVNCDPGRNRERSVKKHGSLPCKSGGLACVLRRASDASDVLNMC